MKITLDLPDNTRAIIVNALYPTISKNIQTNWTLGTIYNDALEDGQELKVGGNNESS